MDRLDHRPKILVTGATGKTGRAVVTQLLQKDYPVRAIVRHRDARSQQLERLGAEVMVADLFDVDQMLRALQGGWASLLLPTVSSPHPQPVMSSGRWRTEHPSH